MYSQSPPPFKERKVISISREVEEGYLLALFMPTNCVLSSSDTESFSERVQTMVIIQLFSLNSPGKVTDKNKKKYCHQTCLQKEFFAVKIFRKRTVF